MGFTHVAGPRTTPERLSLMVLSFTASKIAISSCPESKKGFKTWKVKYNVKKLRAFSSCETKHALRWETQTAYGNYKLKFVSVSPAATCTKICVTSLFPALSSLHGCIFVAWKQALILGWEGWSHLARLTIHQIWNQMKSFDSPRRLVYTLG